MTKTTTRRLALQYEETTTEHHSSPVRAAPSVDPELTPSRYPPGEYPTLAKCGTAVTSRRRKAGVQ